MSTASLTVRIAADINDFSKKLGEMTRGVDKAAKKIGDVGKNLTMGVTLPVGLAAVALSRMALENDRTAARMKGSFGEAADAMNERLERMLTLAPVAGTELQQMAIDVNNLGKGLGMAGPQAALLTENVLKMATDLSAKNGTEFVESLDAIKKGLEGSTKGLKGQGIILSDSMIKQEAYRQGLLKTDEELTPLGTALATYSLLVGKSSEYTGEAARQHATTAMKVAHARVAIGELADKVSNYLLPALGKLAEFGSAVVGALNEIPAWVTKTAFALVGLAAAIGPVLFVGAKLISLMFAIRAQMTLVSAAGGLAAFLGTSGMAVALATLAAIAVVIGGIYYVWQKMSKDAEKKSPFSTALDDMKKLLGGTAVGATSTSTTTTDAGEALQKRAERLHSAWQAAVDAGAPLVNLSSSVNGLLAQSLGLLAQHEDKWDSIATAAAKVARDAMLMANAITVAEAMSHGGIGSDGRRKGAGSAVEQASQAMMSDSAIALGNAGRAIADRNDLRMREAAMLLANTFDATREAAVDFAERLRDAGNRFSATLADFKQQWSRDGFGKAAKAGAQEGLGQALASLTPFALAMQAVNKVMEGFMPILDAVMQPLVEFGKILAIIAQPLMVPLFHALKNLGISAALVGGAMYMVAGGIAKAIGGLIQAIGSFIKKIPFLGGVGGGIEDFGKGISAFGQGALNTAADLDKARRDLQALKFGETAGAVDALGEAARRTTSAMLNVPAGFKVALAQFNATDVISGRTAKPKDSGSVVNIYLEGEKIATAVVGSLKARSQRQFGTTTRWAEV